MTPDEERVYVLGMIDEFRAMVAKSRSMPAMMLFTVTRVDDSEALSFDVTSNITLEFRVPLLNVLASQIKEAEQKLLSTSVH